jgi:hypothetical protein
MINMFDISRTTEARTANKGLAKVAVQCSADIFVVNQTLVLHINICGKNRHLRQAQNRSVESCLPLSALNGQSWLRNT